MGVAQSAGVVLTPFNCTEYVHFRGGRQFLHGGDENVDASPGPRDVHGSARTSGKQEQAV